ncbi:Tetratricopeptide repeat-containing protein [Actinopolyspora saharensis]|uniref:Tetratricopeptide repeat-containing protein n=1 Tax=Actinopolyspora saharensis TaxID=995062 RepID=A0A1H0ZEA9_9ACTN|nr:Tetratricopeptide repeat-containing protein [Actinopolyspora saharensis]
MPRTQGTAAVPGESTPAHRTNHTADPGPSTTDDEPAGPVPDNALRPETVHHGPHLPEHCLGTSPTPRQLPPPPHPLVGRDAEQAELDALLRDPTEQSALISISGPAGIGKTALALHWLHWQHARFPDGQLFVEGSSPDVDTPRSAADLLGHLLRSLGVPAEEVPLGVGGRLSRYRSLTSGKSLVVLVDDAVSAAQVRPLLPNSATGALLVTSRMRPASLALDGARLLDVAPLDERSALRALSGLLGSERTAAEPDSARELAELCGTAPLALELCSAHLAERPQWTLQHAATWLRDQRGRGTAPTTAEPAVSAVIDSCYRGLSARAATLYRRLAQHPGPDLPRELARHLAETDEAGEDGEGDHATALAELRRARLLRGTDRRHRFPDLVRAHARTTGEHLDTPASRAQTLRRALHWYLARAVAADLVITPQRHRIAAHHARQAAHRTTWSGATEALDWFDRERANLAAVLTEAHRTGHHEVVWQLCEAMWGFFLHRKHYRDWIDSHHLGIRAAARLGHHRAEARLRCQLGFAHLDLEQFDAVLELCTPALRLAETCLDRSGISTALSQLAKAARGRGDHELSLRYFRRALRLDENTGNRRGIALRCRRIGTLLAETGNHGEAAINLDRALALLTELADHRGRARALTDRGDLHIRRGELAAAETCLTEALAVMRESGSPAYQADVLGELGELATRRGEITTALRHWREAERLYRLSAHPRASRMRARVGELASGLPASSGPGEPPRE